ncbi:hypothetical protein P7K49_017407 [Saguinus oedipus]|uniref:Uncharacterized protein n=1 Tax=Saguinus oedipus TaxID=9490 RepID=A0ABQ9V335_SAGOE|nr:hypothetical protein P7K49_017407 [Saguinus oedipus]
MARDLCGSSCRQLALLLQESRNQPVGLKDPAAAQHRATCPIVLCISQERGALGWEGDLLDSTHVFWDQPCQLTPWAQLQPPLADGACQQWWQPWTCNQWSAAQNQRPDATMGLAKAVKMQLQEGGKGRSAPFQWPQSAQTRGQHSGSHQRRADPRVGGGYLSTFRAHSGLGPALPPCAAGSTAAATSTWHNRSGDNPSFACSNQHRGTQGPRPPQSVFQDVSLQLQESRDKHSPILWLQGAQRLHPRALGLEQTRVAPRVGGQCTGKPSSHLRLSRLASTIGSAAAVPCTGHSAAEVATSEPT